MSAAVPDLDEWAAINRRLAELRKTDWLATARAVNEDMKRRLDAYEALPCDVEPE